MTEKKGKVCFMNKEIETLKQLVADSNNIVFFGGAGVSTESGVPDFRSANGLYSQEFEYPPEVMLSHSFFIENPDAFYDFYRNIMINEGIEPNPAHFALAELEKANKLKAVITQNIDGLHQLAGSENVIELHGSVHRNYCMTCGKHFGIEAIKVTGIPTCQCGGIIRPDVVLYEEQLDSSLLSQAAECVSWADMMIVGGTSLTVYPAAGFVHYYEGDKLVIINNSETHFDERAALVIRDSIGKVLSSIGQ